MDVRDSTPVIKAVKIYTADSVLINGILEMFGYLMLKHDISYKTFSFRNCWIGINHRGIWAHSKENISS